MNNGRILLLSRNLPCTVQPVFQSRKLRFLLSQPEEKDALVSNARCMYLYSCACDKHYVGYTTRHLHQRVTEHQRSTSAIAKHCSSSGCSFAPERFSIIARCASKFELQVRESLEIYFRKPELNDRDEYCCSVLYRSRYWYNYISSCISDFVKIMHMIVHVLNLVFL